MSAILAIFVNSGKIPWTKELLNIYLSGSTAKSKTSIALKDIIVAWAFISLQGIKCVSYFLIG